MRTCNHHPLWQNEPLRLTEEQRKNPYLVISEFFECYHLHDCRHALWNWLVEILSSSGSISIEALERSNHIYFYEKMEALIEACLLILRQRQEQEQAVKMEPIPLVAGTALAI